MKTITVAELKVGDTFSFMPEPWYGQETVISTAERKERTIQGGVRLEFGWKYSYDLKCDANVVNPPAIHYGIPAETRVILYEM